MTNTPVKVPDLLEAILAETLKDPDYLLSTKGEVPLQELGLDSLSAINLLFRLETDLGITFPDEYLDKKYFSTGVAINSCILKITGGE